METISNEEIMTMDVCKLRQLAREHKIPLDKCCNHNEWRERILLHRKKVLGTNFDIKREFQLHQDASFGSMNRTLDNLLDKVKEAISGDVLGALQHALREDGGGSQTKPQLLEEIQARRDDIKDAQCYVIVAGETNAGKSTLLNLVLGMNILPTSIFSCTAVVCALRYAPDFHSEVVFNDGRLVKKTYASVDDARNGLNEIVAEKDDEKRLRQSEIRTINIYLPSVVLQNGVALVDTPGIGENATMDQVTMDFVQRNSAAAYIYVIKTDNAGGVQDDRLLEFLRAILKHNDQGEGRETFDPSSAMFVCNRWDQIPSDQKDRVKENVFSKLKDVWPKFEERQVSFISTVNSQMHWDVNQDYVTQEYEALLRGFKDTFNRAHRNSVNQHYRWLKNFLQRSSTFLQTTINQCRHSDDELAKRFKMTCCKLDILHTKAAEITAHLGRCLEEEVLKLCDVIADILSAEKTDEQLREWDMAELPQPPSSGAKAANWVEEIDMAITRRIVQIAESELTIRGIVSKMEDAFRLKVQQSLLLLDEEIDSIVKDMNERKSLSSSTTSLASTLSDDDSTEELLFLYKTRDGRVMKRLKHTSRLSRGSEVYSSKTLDSVPKVALRKLLDKMLQPLHELLKVFQMKRKQSLFQNDPSLYMTDRSSKLREVILKDSSCRQQLALKHRQRLDNFISNIEQSIPRFIALNKQLMDDILKNRQKFLSQRNEMVTMMEKLEPARELLRGFGSLYIQDMTADNIAFSLDEDRRRSSVVVSMSMTNFRLPDSGYGASIKNGNNTKTNGPVPTRRLCQGLWSTYRKGYVTIEDTCDPLMGRTYIQKLPEDELIREIARLRIVHSPNLASFFGMTRIENSVTFLFLGDLTTARRYIGHGFHEMQVTVCNVLKGTLKGLQHLHREGLVHQELTLSTVTVNREGEVKLCGGCIPRRAHFPPDAGTVDAKPFVCLSPEVLRGDFYTADDDIYSFGLMAWELCLPEEPYAKQKTWTLENFRQNVHPSSMLGLDNMALTPTLSAILRGCLLPARGLRLKMEQVQFLVEELRSDPTVNSLSNTKRRVGKRLSKHSRGTSEESN